MKRLITLLTVFLIVACSVKYDAYFTLTKVQAQYNDNVASYEFKFKRLLPGETTGIMVQDTFATEMDSLFLEWQEIYKADVDEYVSPYTGADSLIVPVVNDPSLWVDDGATYKLASFSLDEGIYELTCVMIYQNGNYSLRSDPFFFEVKGVPNIIIFLKVRK